MKKKTTKQDIPELKAPKPSRLDLLEAMVERQQHDINALKSLVFTLNSRVFRTTTTFIEQPKPIVCSGKVEPFGY